MIFGAYHFKSKKRPHTTTERTLTQHTVCLGLYIMLTEIVDLGSKGQAEPL